MISADSETLNVHLDECDMFVNQSREAFDMAELLRLSEDMKTRGQLQAGVAWFDPGRGRYLLICGERRYRALKLAGIPTISVRVLRGNLSQSQMLEINLAENIQRASLNAIERGKAFHRIMQLEDITAKEVAARTQVSDATVCRELSLLELSPALQEQVAAGNLPVSVASLIVRLSDDEARRALAEKYLNGQLNRDGVASEVKEQLTGLRPAAKGSKLSCKVDGVSFSLSSSQDLTWESVNAFIVRLSKAAEKLHKSGKELSELPKSLRVSG